VEQAQRFHQQGILLINNRIFSLCTNIKTDGYQ